MKIEEIVAVEEIGSTDKLEFLDILNDFIRREEFRIINIQYNPLALGEIIYYSALVTYAYTTPSTIEE